MGGWWAAASTYAAAYSLSASVTKPRKPWRLDLRYFMIDSRSCPAAIFGSQKSSIGSFTCSEYWKGRGPVVNEVGERMDGLVSSVCPTIHVVLLYGIYLFFPFLFVFFFLSFFLSFPYLILVIIMITMILVSHAPSARTLRGLIRRAPRRRRRDRAAGRPHR